MYTVYNKSSRISIMDIMYIAYVYVYKNTLFLIITYDHVHNVLSKYFPTLYEKLELSHVYLHKLIYLYIIF